ncbi:hypothetical protein [Pseudomonas salomonii]|uniref:Uncharacterized protein n=1 Tax=Pseudomonas salomonii TaxID=191391 RepID=A0ABS9GP06_9PSED|nr:hypothetical protein [Pseudomonas salomonii]MCF5546137.1 hypothetical protein [Pseudomonas salomonii]
MSEMKQAVPLRPKLTIAFWSFALGVGSTIATVGIHYGRQDSDLINARERVEDFKKTNDGLNTSLNQWIGAYNKQAATLAASEERVRQLENDRCTPIKLDVDDIRSDISSAMKYYPERVGSLEVMMEQYQQTLRACYAAATSPTRTP